MCEWSTLFFFSKARVEKATRILEFYERTVVGILERIGSSADDSKRKFEEYFIANRLKQKQNDFDKTLLAICNGDVTQYKELKKSTIDDYIVKLDSFVSSIEAKQK